MNHLIKSYLLIGIISILGQCTPSLFQIDADFPGGNIIVMNINGDTVQLQQDLRDTEGHWFYWSFRVKGAAGRTVHFEFTNGKVIASRGPAVSTDGGLTWRWLSELGASATAFQYTFGPKENEVYFGMGMNYTEKDLYHFLDKYKDHSDLKIETLCTSRKGRNVELLRIQNQDSVPDYKIVLLSRHHAGEMMATRSLEGIIETVLSDSDDGRWLRNHGDFFIVPFVDKDGVEDGDQGKNRLPHDHNRDYIQRIYPEILAITEQIPEWSEGKPLFFLDLHCPYYRGGVDGIVEENEMLYILGRNTEFVNILKTVKKGSIPYLNPFASEVESLPLARSNDHRPPADENRPPATLQSSGSWASSLPNTIYSGTLEVPFANASGVVVDAKSTRDLGHDLAKTIRIFLESQPKAYFFNF